MPLGGMRKGRILGHKVISVGRARPGRALGGLRAGEEEGLQLENQQHDENQEQNSDPLSVC